jgi:predicted ATPase
MRTFGELLRKHRLAAGFSQEELAERANMSTAAVSALERGLRRAPYKASVQLLAGALSLSEPAHAELQGVAARVRLRADAAGAAAAANNVPIRLSSFVGRATQIAEIDALLEQQRLITLTGSGGIGKTRHAIEVVRRRLADQPIEAWFVDLAPVAGGEFVASAIAAVLRVPVADASSALPGLVSGLRDRRCLIILDNCEHVIDAAAETAGTLLRGCPQITILATSRERLAIEGEYVYRLPALHDTDALRLLSERATAAGARLTLRGADVQIATDVCRRLDGLPLAIELVAPRVAAIGIEALHERLKDHLVISGWRDLPERQQTMMAAIAWSYDLLDDAGRALLRRFAIFRAPGTLDAAEAVCASDALPRETVAQTIASLVGKSLLEPVAGAGRGRYAMMESVRAFGLRQLEANGESVAIMRAHASRLAKNADEVSERLRTFSAQAQLPEFVTEIEDVRAALEWSLHAPCADDAVLGARIIYGFRIFWMDLRRYRELERWAETALARIDEQRFPAVVSQLFRVLIQAAERNAAVVAIERALQFFTRIGDTEALAGANMQLAFELSNLGRAAEADAAIDRAFTHAQSLGPATHLWVALYQCRSSVHLNVERVAEAEADFEEYRRRLVEFGFTDERWSGQFSGRLAFAKGEIERAIESLRGQIDYDRESQRNPGGVMNDLAAALIVAGETDEAEALAREAFTLTRHEQIGSPWWSLQHLAAIAALRDQPKVAAQLRGAVDAACARNGSARFSFQAATYAILNETLKRQLTEAQIAGLAARAARLALDEAADLAASI